MAILLAAWMRHVERAILGIYKAANGRPTMANPFVFSAKDVQKINSKLIEQKSGAFGGKSVTLQSGTGSILSTPGHMIEDRSVHYRVEKPRSASDERRTMVRSANGGVVTKSIRPVSSSQLNAAFKQARKIVEG